MTPHKKRKAAGRKKTIRDHGVVHRSFEAKSAQEAFNKPGQCGECSAEVALVFRPEMALEAPNGFVIPGFGKCTCGASVMSLVGPPQPDGFTDVIAQFFDDFNPDHEGHQTTNLWH